MLIQNYHHIIRKTNYMYIYVNVDSPLSLLTKQRSADSPQCHPLIFLTLEGIQLLLFNSYSLLAPLKLLGKLNMPLGSAIINW